MVGTSVTEVPGSAKPIHFIGEMGKSGRSYCRFQRISRLFGMEKKPSSLLFSLPGGRTLFFNI